MIQTISIKDTRNQLADLINQVDFNGREFIISKFGKPKAMLTPLRVGTIAKKTSRKPLPGFGAWKNRKDIVNSADWVTNQRKKWSNRYGQIFD